jgi:hypothetical protein
VNNTKAEEICEGGQSFNCFHGRHRRRADVLCWRCKTRMGCEFCCEIPRERLCLVCRDWANGIALKAHGPLVRDPEKRIEGLKIVWMIANGTVSQEDGEKLLRELFAG